MAYANLSEAVKSSAFETLSPEAKQHVFDTYSAKDEAYQGLSAEAKAHVQETYLGKAPEPTEEKGMVGKTVDYLTENRPSEHLDISKIALEAGKSGLIPLAVGAMGAPLTGGTSMLAGGAAAIPFAVAGGAEEIARQMGTSRLTQFATGVTGGGLAEAATTGIANATIQAGKTLQGILTGNTSKLFQGLKGFAKESEEAVAKRAATAQAKTFGTPEKDFTSGTITGEAAAKTQQELAKKYEFGKSIYEPSLATKTPAEGDLVPFGTKIDTSVPSTKLKEAPAEEMKKIYTRDFKINPETGMPNKVSDVLRDEMYMNVNNVTLKSPSQRFSASPEFKSFQKELQTKLETKEITKADYNSLISALETDTGSLAAKKRYGETVDRIIREWQGKPGATGQSSLSASTENSIRNDLRDKFATWGDKVGIGKIEKDYRESFRAEKVAEATDKIPRIISQYGDTPQMNEFIKQMGKDLPESKGIILKEMEKHFANMPANKISSEFDRLGKILVKSESFTPVELKMLKEKVDMVSKVAEGGSLEGAALRAKRLIIKALQTGAVASGVSAIRPKEEQ